MAYQDWLNQASNTSAVSSNIPPALIPAGNSVLNEQPVPSSYTSNQSQRNPGNTAISSQGQINSIMNSVNPQVGTTNPFATPGTSGGGGGPSSWSAYSSGGSSGPTGPGTGTGNTGVTQNWNESEGSGPIGWGSHTTIANTNNPNSIEQQQISQLSGEAEYNYGHPSPWHNATSDANNDGTIDWWDSQVGGTLGGSWSGLGNNILNSFTGGLFNFGSRNRN